MLALHFCFCLLPFTRGRQIKLYNFPSTLIHYRDYTHPIPQSSIFRVAPTLDTMSDLQRTLWWMTCFQHGSLTSSRIIGITQGILCALIIIVMCFFSLLSLVIFHCQSVYWFPCLFLLLIDVTMLITILLCMFCRFCKRQA